MAEFIDGFFDEVGNLMKLTWSFDDKLKLKLKLVHKWSKRQMALTLSTLHIKNTYY